MTNKELFNRLYQAIIDNDITNFHRIYLDNYSTIEINFVDHELGITLVQAAAEHGCYTIMVAILRDPRLNIFKGDPEGSKIVNSAYDKGQIKCVGYLDPFVQLKKAENAYNFACEKQQYHKLEAKQHEIKTHKETLTKLEGGTLDQERSLHIYPQYQSEEHAHAVSCSRYSVSLKVREKRLSNRDEKGYMQSVNPVLASSSKTARNDGSSGRNTMRRKLTTSNYVAQSNVSSQYINENDFDCYLTNITEGYRRRDNQDQKSVREYLSKNYPNLAVLLTGEAYSNLVKSLEFKRSPSGNPLPPMGEELLSGQGTPINNPTKKRLSKLGPADLECMEEPSTGTPAGDAYYKQFSFFAPQFNGRTSGDKHPRKQDVESATDIIESNSTKNFQQV